MITTPMPALKPISTGSEMKLATKPSRRKHATASIAPTSSVSVAVPCSIAAGSPLGATALSSAAVRIAIVEVVLTLSTRDVPRIA